MVKTRQLKPSPSKNATELLVEAVVEGMQDKKGKEIIALNLKKLGSSVADYFVVCHGDSRPQLEALVKSVEEKVHKVREEWPRHVEGMDNAEWVLLDYFDVVVHIFLGEKREFYGVERLWADAEEKKQANR